MQWLLTQQLRLIWVNCSLWQTHSYSESVTELHVHGSRLSQSSQVHETQHGSWFLTELHQTTFLPIKWLSEVAHDQLQRALLEGDTLKGLLPALQTAVAQMITNISAVLTSLYKLNELLSQDRDWSAPVDHTAAAKGSTISEGSKSINEHTSEANRQTTHINDTTFSKADSRQSQSTDWHDSQTPLPQANTYQGIVEMRCTKSDSAGTHNTTGLIKAHRVVSDRSPRHDVYDPHQQL